MSILVLPVAGFAHIMSIRPIANLEDLQGLKVWVPDGDRISYEASKALGISPVTMPLTDVMTGLQTELIDTIMSPPCRHYYFAVEYEGELYHRSSLCLIFLP